MEKAGPLKNVNFTFVTSDVGSSHGLVETVEFASKILHYLFIKNSYLNFQLIINIKIKIR